MFGVWVQTHLTVQAFAYWVLKQMGGQPIIILKSGKIYKNKLLPQIWQETRGGFRSRRIAAADHRCFSSSRGRVKRWYVVGGEITS